MYGYHDDVEYAKADRRRNVDCLIMEAVMNGELAQYVACGPPLDERLCRYYFKQLLLGVHAIHRQGLAHRDLKPENILLDRNYDIKIGDFGFASTGSDSCGGMHKSFKGTPGFIAPEILFEQPYQGKVADLFSCAVILFYLHSGHLPFYLANFKDDAY